MASPRLWDTAGSSFERGTGRHVPPVASTFATPNCPLPRTMPSPNRNKAKREVLYSTGDTPPGKCAKQECTPAMAAAMRSIDLEGVKNSIFAGNQLVSKKRALSDSGEDPDTASAGHGHCEPPRRKRKKRRKNKGAGRPPPPGTNNLTCETKKWMGDVSGVTWNANGMTAMDDSSLVKRDAVMNLLQERDLAVVTESHSTPGPGKTIEVWFNTRQAECFWEHGEERLNGVGIFVQQAFLQKFDRPPVHTSLKSGRITRLRLQCSSGETLDIIGAYLSAVSRYDRQE